MENNDQNIVVELDGGVSSVSAPATEIPNTPNYEESYKNLEKEYSRVQNELKQFKQTKETKLPKEVNTTVLTSAIQEYVDSGVLSEDTYTKIQKERGLTKPEVDLIISGKKAELELFKHEALSPVNGSEDQYKQLVAWAKDNYDQESIEVFDTVVKTGNAKAIRQQVKLLKQAFDASNEASKSPDMVLSANNTKGSEVYHSMNDLKEAIKDSRYGKDLNYTKQVELKLQRSKF